MKQYLELMEKILNEGTKQLDRTSTGTLNIFGYQMRFDLNEGFPLVTTKKVHLKSIIYELLWFLSGDTNIKYLKDHGVKIWNEWADKNGDLGRIYGAQWRNWRTWNNNESVDQIKNVIKSIKETPNSRRHLVVAYNPGEIHMMALPPCHCLFQFFVANNKLSCQLYQRSADVFLGVPFNIASYSILTHMIAKQCNLGVGEFIWTGGINHLYLNHLEQARLQLSRKPYNLAKFRIKNHSRSLFEYKFEDFEVYDYKCHPPIKAPISV